ncbi:hypothetical protein LEN26_003167 [Aphanomyces euteiches]|nr:hypothetical protein LEN26_003167 [Aphanomyces euteiches]
MQSASQSFQTRQWYAIDRNEYRRLAAHLFNTASSYFDATLAACNFLLIVWHFEFVLVMLGYPCHLLSKLSLNFILHTKPCKHPACRSTARCLKSRLCRIDACNRVAISRGLCIRHGGGPRCSVEGCPHGAKARRLCWKHGGSTSCTVPKCTNRSKARGLCWSHGGGKPCSAKNCKKTALSRGFCWAHGGGKRCRMEGCQRPAYERNGDLCDLHQPSGTSTSSGASSPVSSH